MAIPRSARTRYRRIHVRRNSGARLHWLRRWRKRARWVWCKLNAIPKTARIVVIAATILAVFCAANFVYQVVRKPTEVFAPVSGAFNKTPLKPGANMRRSFASIPPQPSHPSCSPRWRRSRAPAIRSRAPIGGGG